MRLLLKWLDNTYSLLEPWLLSSNALFLEPVKKTSESPRLFQQINTRPSWRNGSRVRLQIERLSV